MHVTTTIKEKSEGRERKHDIIRFSFQEFIKTGGEGLKKTPNVDLWSLHTSTNMHSYNIQQAKEGWDE